MTCRMFSSCLLYSWIRLTWRSNIEAGSILTPRRVWIVELAQPAARDASADQRAKLGIGFVQPGPLRNTVRQIDDAIGKEGVEILEQSAAHQLGMHARHAVDPMAADDRQMRHAHGAGRILV